MIGLILPVEEMSHWDERRYKLSGPEKAIDNFGPLQILVN
jgi:hypothetical protein